ncbi:DUF4760 domain-containing protein [Undibacterium sp. Ji22W]|uniref:DUF4760 domain-containing protein n=1 Tax=Undibacterium sp. Ji22W TaxID=3413038 RepID=UPI003BF187DE
MDYLIQHKNQIEILYLLSGPIMLVTLLIGLAQLWLVRKDIAAKYKRECLNTTLNIFDQKIPKIVELQRKLYEIEDEGNVSDFNYEMKTFNFRDLPDGNTWITEFQSSPKMRHAAINLLNEIELLARVILSGMADEDFAYKAENVFYIETVSQFKSHIAFFRDPAHPNTYEVIIELYERWSKRRKIDDVEQKIKQSVDELSTVPKVSKIRSIGQ